MSLEDNQFDVLARDLSGPGTSRRQVMRTVATALIGSTLGSLAAQLGLTGGSAKGKRTSRKHAHHPSHHPASRHRHSKDVHSQGKGKGKKHNKKRKDPKSPPPLSPLPPGCQNCNECQMCQDGACVPDSALNGVRCLGSGAACGYCQGGQCAGSAEPPCPDGTCPQTGQCCSGEQRCPDPDPESPTGFACVGLNDCCPDQKRCAGGCVYKQACCPEERPQDCGQCGATCVNGTWQCSAQRPCGDGTCVAHDACCDGEKPCSGGGCVPKDICCAGERKCEGNCIPLDVCCPEDPPASCHYPQEQEKCCHGERVCRHQFDTPTCEGYDWLVYNSATCTCECPAGSVQVYPDQPWCCPADHPHYALGAVCLRDVDNRGDFVCPLGCHVCGLYNNVCCWP